jgi:gas vesicle protein
MAVGLFVGAGMALLLAPRSGPATRRALRRGVRRMGDRGQDAWLDLRDELRRAAIRLRRVRRRRRFAAEIAD